MLAAEISVANEELRATHVDYQMGKNQRGQVVPLPKFVDGQQVPVHTIVKSSDGIRVVKTINWTYVESAKTLRLKQTDHGGDYITIPNFNNDNGRKWYVAGMIGGDLNGYQVEFNGEKVLTETDGSENSIAGSLHVPYYFTWTELTIDEQKGKTTGTTSYRYASALSQTARKFQPLGSLIAYELGNAVAGTTSLIPESFTVSSNAFTDQGYFNLDNTPVTDVVPKWVASTCAPEMTYSFSSTPTALTLGSTAPAKKYYAWVMPYETSPAEVRTRVMIRFQSTPFESLPEIHKRDYTRTYFTSYVPSGAVPQSGKIYTIKAMANRNLKFPLQYVTEYNLAGGAGDGATNKRYVKNFQVTNYYGTYTTYTPDGVLGAKMRFSNRNSSGVVDENGHLNDRSGYYSWHLASGKIVQLPEGGYSDGTSIADGTLIDMDGTEIRLGTKYRTPEIDDLWGVFPVGATAVDENGANGGLTWVVLSERQEERLKVGEGTTAFVQNYTSRYASQTKDAETHVVYGIRFGRQEDCISYAYKPRYIEYWDIWDYSNELINRGTYVAAPDDAMRTAYRYTRVGSKVRWESRNATVTWDQMLRNRIIVEAVYLGNEIQKTSLADISTDEFWDRMTREGKVLKREFPVASQATNSGSTEIGKRIYYISQTAAGFDHGHHITGNYRDVRTYGTFMGESLPLRLFYKD